MNAETTTALGEHEARVAAAIAQLEHYLTNHPPVDERVVARLERVREYGKLLGEEIIRAAPESRERSLALTNLEQTVMWAVAGIARNQ